MNISSNAILSEKSGKALADALAQNAVLKSLDVSDNQDKYNDGSIKGSLDGPGFAKELAVGLSANGALSKLTFGGDGDYYDSDKRERVPYEPVTLEVGMKEADFSNKDLGASGAIIVGAWISHKDNGALTSLNVSDNQLGGYEDDEQLDIEWISDMTGIEALAAAIPLCK